MTNIKIDWDPDHLPDLELAGINPEQVNGEFVETPDYLAKRVPTSAGDVLVVQTLDGEETFGYFSYVNVDEVSQRRVRREVVELFTHLLGERDPYWVPDWLTIREVSHRQLMGSRTTDLACAAMAFRRMRLTHFHSHSLGAYEWVGTHWRRCGTGVTKSGSWSAELHKSWKWYEEDYSGENKRRKALAKKALDDAIEQEKADNPDLVLESGNLKKESAEIMAIRKELAKLEKTVSKDAEFLNTLQGTGKLNSIGKMLEAMLQVDDDKVDAKGNLFAVRNGVYDMEYGKFRQHLRSDMNTHFADVEYDPDNWNCPAWDEFLQTVTQGDDHLEEYLNRIMGYFITASTAEQCIFILYGGGGNGKSTFLNVLQELMGEYAATTSPDVFTGNDRNQEEKLAQLRGKRLVLCTEVDANAPLREALVKALTGEDAVMARNLYQSSFTYKPTYKVVMACNHRPTIRGTDHGIWRRIRLIPWDFRIPKDKVDPNILDKLRMEYPAILNKMIAGYHDWRRKGLPSPKVIETAISTYRKEMDGLAEFVEANLRFEDVHGDGRVNYGTSTDGLDGDKHYWYASVTDVRKRYAAWCREMGERQMNPTKFRDEITARARCRDRNQAIGNGMFYHGVHLVDPKWTYDIKNHLCREGDTP